MMIRHALATSLPILWLAISGCAEQALQSPTPESAVEARAVESTPSPGTVDFTLPDIEGRSLSLSALRGHPVIIEVWATWCEPCREEIPELNSLYKRYRDRGLVVLGISLDALHGNGLAAVLPFVREFHIAYPILLADRNVVDLLNIDGAPITYFISPEGRLVSRIDGVNEPGELTTGTLALFGPPGCESSSAC